MHDLVSFDFLSFYFTLEIEYWNMVLFFLNHDWLDVVQSNLIKFDLN